MKILLLTMSRTGSTYLTKTLNSAMPENSIVYYEPFNENHMFKYKKGYVNNLINVVENNTQVLLKSHFDQINRIKKPSQIDYFLNNSVWYKILLLRKDLFSCTLSHTVAHLLNNFGNKLYYKTSLKIDVNLFLDSLESKTKNWKKFSNLKIDNNYNQIIYFEDLKFNSEDFKLIKIKFNLDDIKTIKNTNPTPKKLINIENKDKLYNIFLNKITKFNYPGISNQDGFLELI